MKSKIALCALTLICVVTLSATPQSTSPPKWEYKLEYKMNEAKANKLGAEGWELAAIESTSSAGIATNVPTYVFKRRKE